MKRVLLAFAFAVAAVAMPSLAQVSTAASTPTSALTATSPSLKEIVFGGEANFQPMAWLKDGRALGFNIDLESEVAQAVGRRSTHKLGSWPEVMSGLLDGGIDAAPMYKSPGREKYLLFSEPFYYLHHVVYVRRGQSGVKSVADLAAQKIAVEKWSFASDQLNAEVPEAIQFPQASTLRALQALSTGEADYAIVTSLTAQRLVYEYKLDLEVVGAPFWPVAYAFAVRKDRPELVRLLDAGLASVNASGQFQTVYRRWESELVPVPANKDLMKWMLAGVASLALILGLLAAGQVALRKVVATRTRELREAMGKMEQAEAALQASANFDSATRLAKPTHFINQLEHDVFRRLNGSVASKELMVVRLLDLDAMVCALGFSHAERVVMALAAQLAALPQSRAAYFGRGVFAVCMDTSDGSAFIDRMERALASGQPGALARLAGGSAYWPKDGTDAALLVRRAETALAVSVQRKRKWTMYQSQLEPDPRELDILASSTSGDTSGIYPVFQAQLDLATGKLQTAEVLVRWKHPVHGELSPASFIPILENSGLISRLTEVMIGHSIRVAALLAGQGVACAVSVNVTVHDLIESDLVAMIQSSLKTYSGRAEYLRLELTETGVASDPQRVTEIMGTLRGLGILFSIDDFGTGFSSLSHLSKFPVHDLKIDQSFVTDMLRNERHSSIVRSTIAMAKGLGLATIAEGVEDGATLERLREEGCGLAQGYFISKPLPEQAFVDFMRAKSS
jgi:EAL domain-containing protein (putative c-di-GMP-specific phosphodiesterase class I)/ABC-type amino acid transport substrate-binding protein/GGDEF domain-containing protein